MLYVIKDNKVYMKVKGNYNIEDFRQYVVREDERPNLIWNKNKQKLEVDNKVIVEEIDPGASLKYHHHLVDIMRGTELWSRILDDGEKSLKLNVAVTLLIASVTNTQNVKDFKASLKKYINALEDTKSAKALTAKEKSELQTYINQSKFNEVDLNNL